MNAQQSDLYRGGDLAQVQHVGCTVYVHRCFEMLRM